MSGRPLNRSAFLVSSVAACFAVSARPVRATGGLDVDDQSPALHQMRVLLASDSYAPVVPIDAWHFAWDGRTYRGTAATVSLPDGRTGLVNTLPLDAYLYGVLSKEVGASWAAGSQQAQAIVARTYALLKLRPARPYDVTAGEADQNYGGIAGETVAGRAAVDATGGIIVTYGGLPAHVAYSACCGGRTADARDVWGTSYPYLVSIDDPNCVGTPDFDWNAALPVAVLDRALGRGFSSVGSLRDVSLQVDGVNERPRAIDFEGDMSDFATSLPHFRASVGASVVRSAFVHSATLDRDAENVELTGTGYGHGVGLCQWGARMLGRKGATASQIVAFYFPGTSLGRG